MTFTEQEKRDNLTQMVTKCYITMPKMLKLPNHTLFSRFNGLAA